MRWLRYFSLGLLLLGSPWADARGQVQLPQVTTELRSPVDTVRVRAFYELLNTASAGVPRGGSLRPRVERLAEMARRNDEVLTGLIDLLHLENSLGWTARPGLHPEAFSNYYGDLVGAVAALGDERAIGSLIRVINTGWMAIEGLAALGERAVPEVLKVLDSPEGDHRRGALLTLGRIAERAAQSGISGARLSEIRSALVRVARDTDPWVRSSAIVALRPFGDDEVRQIVQAIARTDPYSVMRGGVEVFPVRAAARAWLEEHPRRQ